MYYWKYPENGTGGSWGPGTVSYSCTGTTNPISTPLAGNPQLKWQNDHYLWWTNGQLFINGWWDNTKLQTYLTLSTNAAVESDFQSSLNTLYNELPLSHSVNYTANYSAFKMNWSLMQDNYKSSYSDQQEYQIGFLDYELGVALGMDYGLNGSGAFDRDIPGVLTGNFGYNSSSMNNIGLFVPPYFSSPDAGLMAAEISEMRPCFIGGQGASDGHTWLVYGCNTGTSPWQFLMNLGWGGVDNGWYSYDNVPQTDNGGPYGSQMDCVSGMAPPNVRFVGGLQLLGFQTGDPFYNYQNVSDAVAGTPNGGTIILQAQTTNHFSGTINQSVTLKGMNVTIMP